MKIRGYDYKSRKKKVEEILENTNFINEVKRFLIMIILHMRMVIKLGLVQFYRFKKFY